ncbi:hypothetical protein CV102_22730 [Natronococcus pandeyae]|uniref:Microcin J25-processing protein McjB C-terminal domain-containing protein n=1 Tax=Natronococcus pandeyae TaxID=2055836 RepID=A0A8J8TN99_9EURY|nr:hypothetical protein CV102_22730 [Natronococcus pandeyae]
MSVVSLSSVYGLAQLERRDRYLLAETIIWLVLARFTLRWAPVRWISQLLGWIDYMTDTNKKEIVSVERIGWAVRTAADRLPGRTTCFARAIAGYSLLARHGHRPQFRIGVTQTTDRMEAHAWIECENEPVIGNIEALAEYRPLPITEGEP